MPLAVNQHILRALVAFLGIVWAGYVLSLAYMAIAQRQFIYFPDKVRFTLQAAQLDGFTEMNYVAADGTKLRGFYAPPTSPRRFSVVFFHGNAGNFGHRADKIKRWREQGYGIMLATYRGYDGNDGSPSEAGLYNDAKAAIMALKNRNVEIKNMVLYGESLGAAVAVEIAAQMGNVAAPAALVLEVPFTSLADVGAHHYPFIPVSWLLRDTFESVKKIQNVSAPILILEAGKDEVVPPRLARQLFEAAPAPKKILTNSNATHNAVYSSPDVVAEMLLYVSDQEKVVPAPAATPPEPKKKGRN